VSDEFFLRHKNRHGVVKRSAITDYLWLTYRNVVNEPGRLNFGLHGDHDVVDTLADFDQFEVWRRNVAHSLPWHIDFYAIYREPHHYTDDDGVNNFDAKCPGQMSILGYRHIAYAASVVNRSQFTNVPAETIAKTLVAYNCTSLATTADGRHRNGDLAAGMGMSIVVAPDQGRGNIISKSFANGKLLRALTQTLAPISGGDFALTQTAGTTWTFEFYPGQLGDDKSIGSNRVEFSLERGNLLRPSLRIKKLDEATVAIIGGKGRDTSRIYAVAEGDDYRSDNDIEIFVNATNEDTDGLPDAGATKLSGIRALKVFDFGVLQTAQTFYARQSVIGKTTYREGDIVSIVYRDDEYVRKVRAIKVDVQNPGAGAVAFVSVETEDV